MVHTMFLAGNYIPVRHPSLQQFPYLFPQGFQCDVVFGAPSANCNGTGICKITGTNGFAVFQQKKECRKTKAILIERPDNQGISLIFFRNLLCSQLYRRHFWKGILKMDEACPLTDGLRANMQHPYQQILPGQYTVVEENGYFRVDVDCQL